MHFKLILPKNDFDSKSVKRLISSLSKQFSTTRAKDVDKAVELAIYLYVLDDSKKTPTDLLESFTGEVTDSNRSAVWASKRDAMSLQSYIALNNSQKKEAERILNDLFQSNTNYEIDDTNWIIDEGMEELSYYEPLEESAHDLNLTKKEKTLGYYSNIVTFLFPFLVSRLIRNDSKNTWSRFEKVIGTELSLLAKELKND